MKILSQMNCCLFGGLFLTHATLAQVRWVGAATGGSWMTASNWSTGNIPNGADSVLISSQNNDTLLIRQLPAVLSLSKLHIVGNTKVRFWGDTTTVLTLTGATGVDFLIDSTAMLVLAADSSFNTSRGIQINLAVGATAEIRGHLHFSSHSAMSHPHRLQALSANAVIFKNKSIFSMGTGASGNPFGTGSGASVNQSVVFEDGATYIMNSGSNPFGASSANVAVFRANSLYKINAVGASLSNRTYGNVELINSAYNSTSTGSGTFTVNHLTLSAGKMRLNVSNILLKGHLQIAANALLTLGSGTTFSMNGIEEQSIEHQNNLIFVDSTSVLKIDNPQGARLKKSLLVKHLNLSNGSLLLDTAHLEVTHFITGGSLLSHVATLGTGRLKRPNVGASTTLFPVGASKTSYNPVAITNVGLPDTFSVRVDTSVTAAPNFFHNKNQIVNREWHIWENEVGGSNVLATFSLDSMPMNLNNTVFTPTQWVVGSYSGNTWSEMIASRNQNHISVSNLTQLNAFAIGNMGAFTRVGVVEVSDGAYIKIFPNPIDAVLNLERSDVAKGKECGEWVVLDVLGRCVYQQTAIPLTQINTSHWLSGVYIIQYRHNGYLQTLGRVCKK